MLHEFFHTIYFVRVLQKILQYAMGVKMKTKKIKIDSGVEFQKDNRVVAVNEKKVTLFYKVIELLLISITVYGIAFCFQSGFGIDILRKPFIVVMFGLCVLFWITFSLPKGMEYFMTAELILYGIAGIWYRAEISNGLAVVVNVMIKKIKEYYVMDILEYQQVTENTEYYATVFLVFVMAFMVGVVTYCIVNKVNTFIYAAITFPIALSCLLVGYLPANFYFVIYILTFLAFCGGKAEACKNIEKDAKMQKQISVLQKSISGKITLILLVLGGGSSILFMTLVSENRYDEVMQVGELKKSIQETVKTDIEKLIKGELFNDKASGGLNFGKLGCVGEVEYINETQLEVTVPQLQKEAFYLRGYIGSVYKGNAWNALKGKEEKEEQKQPDFLNIYGDFASYRYNSIPTSEYASYYDEAGNEYSNYYISDRESYNLCRPGENAKAVGDFSKISIKNINESTSGVFAPYDVLQDIKIVKGKIKAEVPSNKDYYLSCANLLQITMKEGILGGEKINYVLDLMKQNEELQNKIELYLGKSVEDYTDEELNPENMIEERTYLGDLFLEHNDYFLEQQQTYLSSDVAYIPVTDAIKKIKELKEYQEKEEAYRDFVYQTYTTLPEEVTERTRAVFAEGAAFVQTIDTEELARKVQLVKEYLATETSYTLQPGALPKNKDFVDYFLFESKQGYCSHYASAATILFRTMGIPARYVEGYVVKPDDLKKATEQQNEKVMKIADTNAHAWTEIYIDGYGWLAIEVTPGYDSLLENSITDSSQIKPTATPQVTQSPAPTAEPNAKATTKPVSEGKTPNHTRTFLSSAAVRVMTILASVLSVPIIGCIFILGRKKYLEKEHRKQKESKALKIRAVYYYRQLEKLLWSEKIIKSGLTLKEAIVQEQLKVSGIKGETWTRFAEIMNKAAFGKQDISLDELEVIVSTQNEIRVNIYKKSSKWKQLYYEYVKVV